MLIRIRLRKIKSTRLLRQILSWSWSQTDWIDMKNDKGSIDRFFYIKWKGEPRFWWYRNEVRRASPDETHVPKLVEIAHKLGAKVTGDDGEEYT